MQPLIRIGAFLAIIGFASSALYWYTNFRIFSFLDRAQPGIGIGIGVLGVILVIAGVLIERNKKTKSVDGPGSFGAPPQGASPFDGQQAGPYNGQPGQPGQVAGGGQGFPTQGHAGPAGQQVNGQHANGQQAPGRAPEPGAPGQPGVTGQPGQQGNGPIQGPGFGPRP